ncbi:GLPGLI family protein [Faecalibacter sp. LW9]|uniref:GLPGLI family protein n=1 Tax=Faecalibacter sp. LW9 TaxID=3103144 RepID=UPI002AFF3C8E|nr:GLPGLI family protein [Faecalibacter sp. LW9]
MKINITFTFLLLFQFAFAQSGITIQYEQVSIPTFPKSEGSGGAQIDAQLKQALARPTFYELKIKDQQSFYSKIDPIDNSQGLKVVYASGIFARNLLLDFNQNLSKREWEVNHKKYIVTDTIVTHHYELTREKGMMLGYEVKKAIINFEAMKTEVWYAPALPSKFGPSTYTNLPGLVLKVVSTYKEEDEPRFTLNATSIELKDDQNLNSLFKGKEISAQEFKAIEKEYERRLSEDVGISKN